MRMQLGALLAALPGASAVLPTGVLSLDLLPQSPNTAPAFADQLCAPSAAAGWGVPLPARHDSRWKRLMRLSGDNHDGCASMNLKVAGVMVIADRGNCSFVTKALNAQAAGAKGLIVQATKQAVYDAIVSGNSFNASSLIATEDAAAATTTSLVVDKPVFEYDCSRGQAFVSQLASPVWETDAKECNSNPQCPSKMCVLTGNIKGSAHQVCCMWDTFVLMGATNGNETKKLTIPVVYMTISEGRKLQKAMEKYPTTLVARTYRREPPLIDVSSILLWAVGVLTALGAAYYSAGSMHRYKNGKNAVEQRKLQQKQQHGEQDEFHDQRDEIWELDAKHAVGFIAMAGLFLTVFYYVKIGGIIPVLFAVSSAATLTQLVGTPLVERVLPSLAVREVTVPLLGDTARVSELVGLVPCCALAIFWYMHRRTYWLLQDIMGISLCFVFLRTVQLPNLKVATVLLTLAFCYDVFFVFLSPMFFGSSVMEDVATGGPAAYTRSGYPGIDYCERYPHYPACEDPEPMPMLLVLPRVLDWAGGTSMLGLGDIILPGMLLSFALRFDYSSAASSTRSYFTLMAVGYAVGLSMANLAVLITEMGQPALMYLVPTTLGALVTVSKRNGDFRAMWLGDGVDQNDTKRREGDSSTRYSTVRSEAPDEIVVDDPIGRSNSKGSDQIPLLGSG